jgi:hypothetical protein
MAANSIQSLDQSQYLNTQAVKSLHTEQTAVEQQNQKAAATDLNNQAANRVQEAFKINISREGEEMYKASEQVNNDELNARATETIAPENSEQLQTNYSEPAPQASQIVNIVA